MKTKIVCMGTPEFAVPSFKALVNEEYDIAAVVTAPDKPAGRGKILHETPVKKYANDQKIIVLAPRKLEEIKKDIESIAPDLIIVCAYGKMLPSWLIGLPRRGTLNIHPSLLPRWRGASPIPFAILEGDKETGVTIIQMNEKMDEGPILASREFSIFNFQFSNRKGKPTTGELTTILSDLSAKLLIETLPKWINGEIKPMAQNNKETTYSKILTKEDGHIIWTKPAQYIERQIRAFDPWPGTFASLKFKNQILKTFKILDAETLSEITENEKQIGEVFLTEDKKIAVQTGSGLLMLGTVQLEGKKPMPIQEFVNGHPDFIGTILQ